MAAAHDQTMNRVDSQHPAIKERINSSVLELLVIIFFLNWNCIKPLFYYFVFRSQFCVNLHFKNFKSPL